MVGAGVEIGKNAVSSDITSNGSAFLKEDGVVQGNLVVSGEIIEQNPSSNSDVTGISEYGAELTFGGIGSDSLIDVQFSEVTDNYNFNPGTPVSLPPGAYPYMNINSNSELMLSSGDYYMYGLNINTDSNVILDDTDGPIRIFVRDYMSMRESFTDSNGNLVPVYIGYTGRNAVVLDAVFIGTFIAPNAQVVFGQDDHPTTHEGRFVAKDIVTAVGTTVRCHEEYFIQ